MQLNLPQCDLRYSRDADGRVLVYDRLRGKHVVMTPEEEVRQHFVDFLINSKGFPAGYMANEVSLRLNSTSRRCDTLVVDSKRNPLVIVEYKAPEVEITQRTFDQIVRYNMVLHARYLIVSNGMSHYCCRIDYDSGTYAFLKEIPLFNEIAEK